MLWNEKNNKNSNGRKYGRTSNRDHSQKQKPSKYSVASRQEFEQAFDKAYKANKRAWENLAKK